MLRASSDALDLGLDLTTVATGQPPALPFGAELNALATALTTDHDRQPVAERQAMAAAGGPARAERAIAVCATFQMMNRLLDGVGAPVRDALHPIARALGFDPAELPR